MTLRQTFDERYRETAAVLLPLSLAMAIGAALWGYLLPAWLAAAAGICGVAGIFLACAMWRYGRYMR